MLKKPAYLNFSSLFLLSLYLLAVLIIVAPQFTSLTFVSDYTIHFMVLFFIFGFVGFLLDHRRIILSCFGICALLCVMLKNESDSPFISKNDGNSDHLILAHINLANVHNPYDLIPALLKLDCDVVSFVEVTPDWEDILKSGLGLDYKYSTNIVRIDPFGKAIFSKYPISKIDTISYKEMTDISATITTKEKSYTVYSSYIIPPLDKNSQEQAAKQLDLLRDNIGNHHNCIVMGEYNMVYWSELIKKFRFNSKLQSSRRDIIPSSLDVPRDHIFHSAEMICLGIKEIRLQDGTRIGLFAKYRRRNNGYQDETKLKNTSKLD